MIAHDPTDFACPRCGLGFTTRRALILHDTLIHGLTPEAAEAEVHALWG